MVIQGGPEMVEGCWIRKGGYGMIFTFTTA